MPKIAEKPSLFLWEGRKEGPRSGKQIPRSWNEPFPETLIILLNKFTGYYTNLTVYIIFKIILYWLCYYSYSNFSTFHLLHPELPTPSGHSHTIVHVHGSCIQVLWLLHFLYCTLHPHGYSATIHLYFLIPSPLHPFPYTLLLSGNPQNTFHSHDSVSVLLACLACFLDSVVDRYVFIAMLLFIVSILFFF